MPAAGGVLLGWLCVVPQRTQQGVLAQASPEDDITCTAPQIDPPQLLRLLSAERGENLGVTRSSAGKDVDFDGETYKIEELTAER